MTHITQSHKEGVDTLILCQSSYLFNCCIYKKHKLHKKSELSGVAKLNIIVRAFISELNSSYMLHTNDVLEKKCFKSLKKFKQYFLSVPQSPQYKVIVAVQQLIKNNGF